jgi:hypothetical protein
MNDADACFKEGMIKPGYSAASARLERVLKEIAVQDTPAKRTQ